MHQVGNSANITFWRDGEVWLEVLTDALHKTGRGWRARTVPIHYVTIHGVDSTIIGQFHFRSKVLTGRSLSIRVNRWRKEGDR